MEFTYDGLVRHGFGFYNPNHAAALIVLLLPGIWLLGRLVRVWVQPHGWQVAAQSFCIIAEVCLYAALIWTFSRSGVLVLAVSAILWWRFAGDHRTSMRWVWLKRGVMLLLFVGLAAYAGAGQRFTATSGKTNTAASNRLDVWKGGLRMLADNPGGVGTEMSGRVYTLFYNPNERTSYRKLVNSWLTLAVERGLLVAGIVTGAILAAMTGLLLAWRKRRRGMDPTGRLVPAALLTILCGVLLSGSTSTCFDLNILLNPAGTYYGEWNDRLQFGLALLAPVLIVAGCMYGLRRGVSCRRVMTAGLIGAIVFTGGLYGGGVITSRQAATEGVTVIRDGEDVSWACSKVHKEALWILPDGPEQIKELLDFTRATFPDAGYRIALTPLSRCPTIPVSQPSVRVLLAGNNCGYAQVSPHARVLLYKPTTFLPMLRNVEGIYLPKWDDTGRSEDWANNYPRNTIHFLGP